jgi:tetratricopeptide (TPR) repeat protein
MNWGMAWEGFKERPLLGWGQGNYEYVFSKHFDPGMYGEEPWFDRTHNIYFDWLVAGGILGFIAYLLLPLSLLTHLWLLDPNATRWSFRKFIRFETITNLFKERDHVFTPTERAIWTGLLVAYGIHNFFVFDNLISYILFFSILAYLHFKVTEGNETLFGKEHASQDTVVSVALPVTLVVTGAIIWYVNIPGIQTSQTLIDALMQERMNPNNGQVIRQTPEDVLAHYRKAVEIDQLGRQEAREQLVQMTANMYRNQGVNPNTKLAFQELAVSEIEKEVSRNPNSARLILFEGSLYGSIGQLDKAEEALKRAVEITPTKQAARYQLGEVLLLQDKDEEALENFKFAYEIETENSEAAKLYALGLIRNGKDKEAVDLLTEHFGTPYVDDNRLFIEWTNAKRFDIVKVILEERAAVNPDDIQIKVSLAAAYKELGENENAIRLLEEVKESNPEYTEQMDGFIKDIRGW